MRHECLPCYEILDQLMYEIVWRQSVCLPSVEEVSDYFERLPDIVADWIKSALRKTLVSLSLRGLDQNLALISKVLGRASWTQTARNRSSIHPTARTVTVSGASTSSRTVWER